MSGEYLLFAGDHYYPSGGWGDFVGAFDTLDEAKGAILATYRHERKVWAGYSKPGWRHVGPYDWAHIVHAGVIVAIFHPSDDPSDSGDRWRQCDGREDA